MDLHISIYQRAEDETWPGTYDIKVARDEALVATGEAVPAELVEMLMSVATAVAGQGIANPVSV